MLASSLKMPFITEEKAAPATPSMTRDDKSPVESFIDYHSYVADDECFYLKRKNEKQARKDAWICVFTCCCCCIKYPDPTDKIDMMALYCCYLVACTSHFFYYCPKDSIFRTKNCFSLFCNTAKEVSNKSCAASLEDLTIISGSMCDQDVLQRYENNQSGVRQFIDTEVRRHQYLTMTRD